MSQIIKKLLETTDKTKKSCRIIKKHSPDRYVVEDQLLRTFNADSDEEFMPGDRVTVVENRIVGRAAEFANPEIVNV